MDVITQTDIKPKAKAKIKVDAEAEKVVAKPKKEKQPKAEKVPVTPKQWLTDYLGGENIARTVTKKLAEGATIAELTTVAKEYNAAKGGEAKWGEKAGEIRSHFAWLKARGLTIEEVADGKFKVSAGE